MSELETRYIGVDNLRFENGDDRPRIVGYAAVFNQQSNELRTAKGTRFREIMYPGAFAASVKGGDVRALVDHDSSKVLGRTKAGTLSIMEDKHGLLVSIDPPDTTYARDIIESLKRGDISGMSIGFSIPDGGSHFERDSNNRLLHHVRSVNLSEVSVVTFPAYSETEVSVRTERALERAEVDPTVKLKLMRMRLDLI